MFEKLLLAITITFSINFFFQARIPDPANTGAIYQEHPEKTTILVTKPEKSPSFSKMPAKILNFCELCTFWQ